MDRAQTKRKLKRDLEDSVFEFEASVPEIEKWVKEQLENDIPVSRKIKKSSTPR
ncbi:uncharacterized protein BYT42DRAFT_581597 [Radiomyces spectabilis]|uniref:uncharacterized protein n=1 Tax=Radiomyces spectabilis TaxID=64574 RepID=UPI002220C27C|nr:uncharacterized protein BYT42DRAFT_581597 [Radiomyces spectabilis]KAI8371794.1 hypothetical protein BYT42DRAFT_581597 [Radiomyces spectabilis]